MAFVQVPDRNDYKPANTGEPGYEMKTSTVDA